MKEIKPQHFTGIIAATFAVSLGILICSTKFAEKTKLSAVGGHIPLNSDAFRLKAEYIHTSEQTNLYNAFVIGGSKAGAIDTDQLNDATGEEFYNCWVSSLCFEDYEACLEYFWEESKGQMKEILLHLSSHTAERPTSCYDLSILHPDSAQSKLKKLRKEFKRYTNLEWLSILLRIDNSSTERTKNDGSREFEKSYKEMLMDSNKYSQLT